MLSKANQEYGRALGFPMNSLRLCVSVVDFSRRHEVSRYP